MSVIHMLLASAVTWLKHHLRKLSNAAKLEVIHIIWREWSIQMDICCCHPFSCVCGHQPACKDQWSPSSAGMLSCMPANVLETLHWPVLDSML